MNIKDLGDRGARKLGEYGMEKKKGLLEAIAEADSPTVLFIWIFTLVCILIGIKAITVNEAVTLLSLDIIQYALGKKIRK